MPLIVGGGGGDMCGGLFAQTPPPPSSTLQSSTQDQADTLLADDITPQLAQTPGSCPSDHIWNGCYCISISPIILDIAGNGFRLTDAAGGVRFNFARQGLVQMSWTAADSDDAFLVLDRNGNSSVDDATEMFGNLTWQPAPPAGEERHGFRALAVFDENSDGVINAQDAVFAQLRLWQDANHNGISEASELQTLPALGVARLDLDYKESKRADEHGNEFRYRAKVRDARGAQVGRWAWDIFLQKAQ